MVNATKPRSYQFARFPGMTVPRRAEMNQYSRDTVVLIHGMLAGARSMSGIGAALTSARYEVVYWNYPTLNHSLQTHGRNLARTIRDLIASRNPKRLHFAAHSMGSIVLRIALQSVNVPSGSRMVLLAPPNSGSRLTRLPMGPFATWFPQLMELSESPDSLVNRLPEPKGIDVGVVAAERDQVVDIERTFLTTQLDHLVISTTHQRLPSRTEAIKQVVNFLANGRFQRNGSPFLADRAA